MTNNGWTLNGIANMTMAATPLLAIAIAFLSGALPL
jgi:hypothetical protein